MRSRLSGSATTIAPGRPTGRCWLSRSRSALSLLTLIAAQIFATRVSRRILNVWMLLATLVILGVSVWTVVSLLGQRNALIRAQRNGSDSVEVLTASRVLLSRAQSDQSLTLVNRGSDAISPADFDKVMNVLSPQGGIIGEVAPLAARAGRGQDAQRLAEEFADYRAQAARVSAAQKSGQIPQAIQLAVADAASPSSAAARLNSDLETQTNAAQTRFESQASDATSALGGAGDRDPGARAGRRAACACRPPAESGGVPVRRRLPHLLARCGGRCRNRRMRLDV